MLRLNLIRVALFVGVYSVLVPAAFAQHEHPAGDPSKLSKVSSNPSLLLNHDGW
jgi:hypothetical protein